MSCSTPEKSVSASAHGSAQQVKDDGGNVKTAVSSSAEPDRLTVTFTGRDRSDAVSVIFGAIASCDATVHDFTHSVLEAHLTMAVELEACSCATRNIYRELLLACTQLSLCAHFSLSSSSCANSKHETRAKTTVQNARAPYVLTLLSSRSMRADALQQLAQVLCARGFAPSRVATLSARALRCVELVIRAEKEEEEEEEEEGNGGVNALRAQLFSWARNVGVDVALQAESVLRRAKRLVVLDMDSTLIQQEVIDELARHAGVYESVKKITHAAMSGGMDFGESLRRRVRLLRGVSESIFDDVISNLKYTPGARYLCATLKTLGYKLAVISGGFTRVTQHVRAELHLDYDYANTLEVDHNGCFTGRTVGPVVNAQRKADLLVTIAQHERIALHQVIAIGDGANDLPMLAAAGLGIAFNAKPAVQEAAEFRINQPSLATVLYLLGFSEDEQEMLARKWPRSRARPGGGGGGHALFKDAA